MRKKILITGATGFIGKFLVDEALDRNYEVYVTIREKSSTENLKNRNVQIIKMDLSNIYSLDQIIQSLPNFDYIIHNAGITKSLKKDDYYEVNYRCTKRLIYALERNKKKPEKFIYMSSLAAFGPGEKYSTDSIRLTNDPKPITSYGKSKLMAENFIIERSRLPYIIFRPTAVYGPGEKDIFEMIKLINKRFDFKIGFQTQNLTFVYVKDLSRLVFDALDSKVTNKAYFISDGSLYAASELSKLAAENLNKKVFRVILPIWLVRIIAMIYEKWGKMSGKIPPLNQEKIKELSASNWNCDISALQNDFDFKAKYNLKSGMAETILWYKKNGWLK